MIFKPARVAYAHCDLPCGIYDPDQARVEAESCFKIIEKYNESGDEVFRARALVIKEGRADLVKHHVDVLWHDYFKPEHLKDHPDLHTVCWNASKLASTIKQSVDLNDAKRLLSAIELVADLWRETGGDKKTRIVSPS